ncbi:MAG: dTDP-4-dehydrorhamnose reductase [Bacteroidales bacterium]|nr:dTDP-4-dehydrorhamnose reductase [Bacteroidales bacterium]
MLRNILVTGGNGQLGQSLKTLTEKNTDYNFIFVDKEEAELTDNKAISRLFETNSLYAVLHFAAYTAVDKAESETNLCKAINTDATATIARLCETYSTKLLVISTDFVFDGSKTTPYLPSDKPNPLSVYGKTKYEGEQMALQNCKHCLVIRTSWLYSEYGNNFVKTMLRLGSDRKELGVVFDQTGTPCYARDLAKVVLLCLDKDFEGQILHFSNEGVCSWYDFALKIMQLGKKDCHVRPIRTADYPTPASRPAYSVLDKADIKQFLGIEIPHWEESLNECLKRL